MDPTNQDLDLEHWYIYIILIKKAVWRIRDVYPGSRILIFTHPGSLIPDLGSRIQKQQQKREVKKNKLSYGTFLCSHKFHKIVNYFSFEVLKKKIWANFQRIIELFTKKIVKKLLKIWSWDPGSGIRKKLIPDPGSRGQKAPNPGSGSATLLKIAEKKVSPLFLLLAQDTGPGLGYN